MSDLSPLKVLPDCMMPDGGEACKGYTWLIEVLSRERARTLEEVSDWLESNGQPGYAIEVRHFKK